MAGNFIVIYLLLRCILRLLPKLIDVMGNSRIYNIDNVDSCSWIGLFQNL